MRIVAGCSLAITGVLAWAQTGPVVPLQGQLLAVSDRFMVDWQKHDTAAMASLLAPGFVYVGSNGPMPRADVLHDLATQCELKSYRLGTAQMLQTSSESAVLIYPIEQDLTCFGHPQPAKELNTDTFVRQGGRWVIVMTTSTPLETR